MEVINKLLICPACDNDNLNKLDYKLICINCDREYMIRDNIPLMFFQTDWNNAIPKVKPFSPFTINEKLFNIIQREILLIILLFSLVRL